MKHLPQLFENNRAWAGELRKSDPEFFTRLCRQQAPPYFWIGCSDSRVPANQIVGLRPGELFVHRNIANIFVHSDLNALSALHFAVDVLKVSHVIVCGHYGCSGIRASLVGERHGLVDNWLRHIGDVREKHRHRLASLAEDDEYARLCELNVIEQVRNVSNTTVVRDAWARGHSLAIHGWIYGLTDGLLVDLGVSGRDEAEINASYCRAAGS
ncbi:MAG: carbonate dehydratase [Acidobacteria bacterium]|nr:carbonate dehydratase [Acidobacteriota bacterium]